MEHLSNLIMTNAEIDLRIILAAIFGFAIGFERELTNKFAGLRTHMLVCLGACVFTLLSIYGFKYIAGDGTIGTNDPARIAAQIITGIGFIGGGTVLRHGNTVLGLTTAATLWTSAAIGMACGTGMFSIALFATCLTVLILVFIRWFENRVLSKSKFFKTINLQVSINPDSYTEISKIIEENLTRINSIKKTNNQTFLEIEVCADVTRALDLKHLYELLNSTNCLICADIKEVQE